jgi:selenocysteine lyase/cysteine desulfurase
VLPLRGDRLRFSLDMSSGLQRVSPHRGVYEETPHMQLPNPLPIYLDYHATTPVDPRVAAVIVHTMTTAFGNANSMEHVYGEVAAALVTDARHEVAALVRHEVAALVHADPEGVHFTSGSSESIRLAVAHAVAGRGQQPLRVALTTVEHRAVLDTVAAHERCGEVTVRWLPVDGRARLDMTALETACHDGIDLVWVARHSSRRHRTPAVGVNGRDASAMRTRTPCRWAVRNQVHRIDAVERS